MKVYHAIYGSFTHVKWLSLIAFFNRILNFHFITFTWFVLCFQIRFPCSSGCSLISEDGLSDSCSSCSQLPSFGDYCLSYLPSFSLYKNHNNLEVSFTVSLSIQNMVYRYVKKFSPRHHPTASLL